MGSQIVMTSAPFSPINTEGSLPAKTRISVSKQIPKQLRLQFCIVSTKFSSMKTTKCCIVLFTGCVLLSFFGGSCGNKPAGSRIVGGTQAQRGEWPWQALLAQAGGSQFCGGSLIADRWVLTASHCVDGSSASQIVVRMGAHNINDIGQEYQVETIIMHESYQSPVSLAHDIALLKLKTAVTLGGGVGTVFLPDINYPLLEGKRCYITGWGTLASGGNQPDNLQEASVPIVSHAKCEAAYGANNIHETMICAGLDEGGVDACQGDSGGPMVCEFDGKWFIEGATSWGYGCAQAGYYGVYAKLRNLKTWVEDKMNSN